MPGRRAAVRRLCAATTVVAVLLVPTGAAAATSPTTVPADPLAVAAAELVAAARAAQGLPALHPAADLTAVAQAQATLMAAAGSPSHTVDLGAGLCCWSALAENVGHGVSVEHVHELLLASEWHRAAILGDYDEVGLATAVGADGTVWVAQVFRAL